MLKPVATIELVYRDETGSTGAVIVNIPSSSSIETGDAAATALASLIAPMTDCSFIKYRVSWRFQTDAPGIAESGTAIVNTGVFFFEDFDGDNIGLITVPGIKDSLIETTGAGAGVSIDTELEAVIDFKEQVIAMDGCDPFGNLFFRIAAAYRQSRV